MERGKMITLELNTHQQKLLDIVRNGKNIYRRHMALTELKTLNRAFKNWNITDSGEVKEWRLEKVRGKEPRLKNYPV